MANKVFRNRKKNGLLSLYADREDACEPHLRVKVTLGRNATNAELARAAAKEIDRFVQDKHHDRVAHNSEANSYRPLFFGEMLLLEGRMSKPLVGTLSAMFAQRGFGTAVLDPKAGTKSRDVFVVMASPAGQYLPGAKIAVFSRDVIYAHRRKTAW